MRIISVSGFKDSGKSTLCRALLERLAARGLKVGYVKRTQEFVGSGADTDSGAACAMGADVLLWGEGSFRYESAAKDANLATPYEVAARFFPDADAVLLEGGKELALPKIWVLREGEEKPDYPGIFALYDRWGTGDGAAVYGGGELDRLASDLAEKIAPDQRSTRVYAGGREMPLKGFIADFVGGAIMGMLRSLKGLEPGGVRVYIRDRDYFS